MRLFSHSLAACVLLSLPQAAAAQTVPIDSLSAFLENGARSWDMPGEADPSATARNDTLPDSRDQGTGDPALTSGDLVLPEGRTEASPAPVRVSATTTPAAPRQRTRAITPAQSPEPARTSRFIVPWQTGVYQ